MNTWSGQYNTCDFVIGVRPINRFRLWCLQRLSSPDYCTDFNKITALLSQLELLSRSDRRDAEEEREEQRLSACLSLPSNTVNVNNVKSEVTNMMMCDNPLECRNKWFIDHITSSSHVGPERPETPPLGR